MGKYTLILLFLPFLAWADDDCIISFGHPASVNEVYTLRVQQEDSPSWMHEFAFGRFSVLCSELGLLDNGSTVVEVWPIITTNGDAVQYRSKIITVTVARDGPNPPTYLVRNASE